MTFIIDKFQFHCQSEHKRKCGKMSLIEFDFVYVEGNWAYSVEKNSGPGDKITAIFRLS